MFFLDLFKQVPFRILMVALLIILTVYLIRKSIKLFFDKTSLLDERHEETLMHFANQVTKLMGLVFFLIYVLSHFVNFLPKLITGSAVVAGALALILQHIIRDYIMGITYLFERQIRHGDFVIINGNRQGKIEEISLRHIKIRQYDGYLYTISYSNITELQNGNRGMRRVNESLLLNYKQNPDEAFKVIEEVAETCNQKYTEYLLKDEFGEPVECYKFNKITELNVDLRGHKYSLSGLVNEGDFVEASKMVRYELALAAYKNDLLMVDSLETSNE
ncbi:mechanosensitive ion channel family protein [Bacillus sp. AFS041924]|uniref:mechanosensitive ion channel family protein n=1 Tax=Bacillus sp. AFS041924 TaxID=2033503 RepID=UPI000BFE2909|nr:mechanosensitive ion channel domain-containing protein [Bacillus sp. AFS041924]PGS48824.1 mechanosensitive ion channel protein MscS [Bacillus sp. AFS041924]